MDTFLDPLEVHVIISIVQMKKLRVRNRKGPAHGHTAWQLSQQGISLDLENDHSKMDPILWQPGSLETPRWFERHTLWDLEMEGSSWCLGSLVPEEVPCTLKGALAEEERTIITSQRPTLWRQCFQCFCGLFGNVVGTIGL